MKLKTLAVLFATIAATGCWQPSTRTRTSTGAGGSDESTNAAPARPATSANIREEPINSPSTNASTKPMQQGFKANLPADFKIPTDAVGLRMFREYGAIFVAKGVKRPPVVVFKDENEVASFQSGVDAQKSTLGKFEIELQAPALAALNEAVADAKAKGLSITPRDADSSKRTYVKTVSNWKEKVDAGIANWVGKGRLQKAEADRIAILPVTEQIGEIFKLEEQGIFFAKNFDKSIIYSVAPPGTSQHISMLALDVEEFKSPEVRAVLAAHGWFQTVVSDLPHFTYLGVPESQLVSIGLRPVTSDNRTFWVPDFQ